MDFMVRYLPAGAKMVEEKTMTSSSEQELRQMLHAQACAVLAVRRISPRGAAAKFDVAWWCRELRTLIMAGMTVVEAIETIASNEPEGTARSEIHSRLLSALRQGQTLSRAMKTTQAFPEILIASVTASERSSGLGETLDDYLRYEAVLERLRSRVVSAAVYPAVVIGLGAAITVFLLLVVIPRFSRMYVDSQLGLSVATQGVLWLSKFLQTNGSLLLGGMLAMGLACVWLVKNGSMTRWISMALESFGPLSRQWDQFRLAKLYQSLAMMFRGGYSLGEGLAVCQGLQLGPRILKNVADAHAAINEGRAASKAFKDAQLTETVTYRLC